MSNTSLNEEHHELLSNTESNFRIDLPVYLKWKPIRKRILVISSFVALLNPLTASFFLPALPTIIDEFNATQIQISLVYSLYLLAIAASKLIWSPFIDKYSRKWCLVLALLEFILFTYITAYSFDMWFLIAARVLTGIPMSSLFMLTTSIISDIYPPNNRGFAIGVRSLVLLIDILFGAPIGGLLTLYVGWRSTLVVLSLLSTVIYLFALLYVPETLNKEKARDIDFSIWIPVKLLFKPRIFFIALTGGISLGILFLCNFCLSTVVAKEFELDPVTIGLILVPSGISGILFATLGGKVSDILGKKYGRGSRLLFSTFNLLISAVLLIPFAYSFTWNLWSPVLISVVISAFRGASGPGFATFCIEEHQMNVSAVLGGISSGYMVVSFLMLFSAPLLAPNIGWSWMNTIFAGCALVTCTPCFILSFMTINQHITSLAFAPPALPR